MEREGVGHDLITYNSLLKAAAATGRLPDAHRLYAELRVAGLRPSTHTYAALLSAAARARAGDAEWMLQVGGRGAGTGQSPVLYCCRCAAAAAAVLLPWPPVLLPCCTPPASLPCFPP